MNKINLLFVVFLAILISACNDEQEATPISNEAEAFFTFDSKNSTYVATQFPNAKDNGSSPSISALAGNANIIQGGSNQLNLSTNLTSQNVNFLLGVEDYDGYFKLPTYVNTNGKALLTVVFKSELPSDNFTMKIAIEDVSGSVSVAKTISVESLPVEDNVFQVSLSWDTYNDIDLHLEEPNGNIVYYGNPGYTYPDSIDIFYENLTLEEMIAIRVDNPNMEAKLDIDSNPGCILDSVNNENISYQDRSKIAVGEYIVRVNHYDGCSVPEKTNYTVTARLNGVLLNTTVGENPVSGDFEPYMATPGEAEAGIEVMRFSIDDAMLNGRIRAREKSLKFNFNNSMISSTEKRNVKALLDKMNR